MNDENNRPAMVGQVDREVGPLRQRLLTGAEQVQAVEQGWGPADRLCAAALDAEVMLYRLDCDLAQCQRRLREYESLASRMGALLARCRTQIEAYEGACYSEPPPMPPISALLADLDSVLGPNAEFRGAREDNER